MNSDRVVLRPRSSRWLAAAVWALCLLNLISLAVLHEWASLVRAIPVVALIATAAWVLFALPAVVVQPDSVVLVNPLRDVRIPWTEITDVQPGFSLVVRTADRHRYHAWAAPGGSQVSQLPRLQANEQILLHTPLPDDGRFAMNALVDADRAGQSSSAIAAAAIRRGWQLAQAQHPEPHGREQSRVTVRWHITALVLLAAFAVATVAALVV